MDCELERAPRCPHLACGDAAFTQRGTLTVRADGGKEEQRRDQRDQPAAGDDPDKDAFDPNEDPARVNERRHRTRTRVRVRVQVPNAPKKFNPEG